jgi:hypothetical protein
MWDEAPGGRRRLITSGYLRPRTANSTRHAPPRATPGTQKIHRDADHPSRLVLPFTTEEPLRGQTLRKEEGGNP